MVQARPSGGERREQILTAALDLFVEHGIEAVSTRQIASAVGISQPSLYAHFPSRDAIASEVSRRAFDRLQERMAGAVAYHGSTADRLLRVGQEYVRFGLDEPAAYRFAFMLDRPHHGHGHDPKLPATGLSAFGVVLSLFQEIRGSDDEATDIAAQSIWASMHGLVALLLARPYFPWADRERLIDYHLATACGAALAGREDGAS